MTRCRPQAPIHIRPLDPARDEGFVFNAWLRSYRRSPIVERMPNQVYYPEFHEQIEQILARDSVSVLMATTPEDDDRLVGFLVTERLGELVVMHYAYVKQYLRRFGVWRQLAAAAGLNIDEPYFYTFHPPVMDGIAKNSRAAYKPELRGEIVPRATVRRG
jgi:hypothetical protein